MVRGTFFTIRTTQPFKKRLAKSAPECLFECWGGLTAIWAVFPIVAGSWSEARSVCFFFGPKIRFLIWDRNFRQWTDFSPRRFGRFGTFGSIFRFSVPELWPFSWGDPSDAAKSLTPPHMGHCQTVTALTLSARGLDEKSPHQHFLQFYEKAQINIFYDSMKKAHINIFSILVFITQFYWKFSSYPIFPIPSIHPRLFSELLNMLIF